MACSLSLLDIWWFQIRGWMSGGRLEPFQARTRSSPNHCSRPRMSTPLVSSGAGTGGGRLPPCAPSGSDDKGCSPPSRKGPSPELRAPESRRGGCPPVPWDDEGFPSSSHWALSSAMLVRSSSMVLCQVSSNIPRSWLRAKAPRGKYQASFRGGKTESTVWITPERGISCGFSRILSQTRTRY